MFGLSKPQARLWRLDLHVLRDATSTGSPASNWLGSNTRDVKLICTAERLCRIKDWAESAVGVDDVL